MLPGQGLWLPHQSLEPLLMGPVHAPPIPQLLVLHHKVPQEAIEAGPGWDSLLPFERGAMQPCRAVPASPAWPCPRPCGCPRDLHAPCWHPRQAQLLAQGEVFQLQGMDFFLQGLQQLLPGHLGAQGGWFRGVPAAGQSTLPAAPACYTRLARGLVVTLRARLA